MKTIIAVVLFCFIWANFVQSAPLSSEITTFEEFKTYFEREYSSLEEEQRARKNFEQSKQWISENQHRFDYEIGITRWADQDVSFENDIEDNSEFYSESNKHSLPSCDDCMKNLPEHFDWREHIQMSPIITQGHCGACWAFTAAESMESRIAIVQNKSVILSKRELVDCTIKTVHTNNFHCKGGIATQGWEYAMEYGVHLEKVYPYNDTLNHECQTNMHGYKYHPKGYYTLRYQASDKEIKAAMKTYGPIAVRIYGSVSEFRFYRGGLIKNLYPNPGKHGHAVILVGWGKENGTEYWTIRNSWGTHWGEKGFARLQMGINSIAVNDWATVSV